MSAKPRKHNVVEKKFDALLEDLATTASDRSSEPDQQPRDSIVSDDDFESLLNEFRSLGKKDSDTHLNTMELTEKERENKPIQKFRITEALVDIQNLSEGCYNTLTKECGGDSMMRYLEELQLLTLNVQLKIMSASKGCALFVYADKQQYSLDVDSIDQIKRLHGKDVADQDINQKPMDCYVPGIGGQWLKPAASLQDHSYVLMINTGSAPLGLVVDHVLGIEKVKHQPISPAFGACSQNISLVHTPSGMRAFHIDVAKIICRLKPGKE
ncbi:MAG: hypothetical protein BMS9Abin36_1646 [Gammaproteobacteria bacterium]|nr:MAG: hypothetical protein BMS9Abin36_1646 [Gammaproteobacteria bacterium]